MKFYTNYKDELIDNRYRLKCPSNFYDQFHNYFYFSLLPKTLKYKFLSQLNEDSYKIFKDILKIPFEFCKTIEECDYIVGYIATCSPQSFDCDISYTKYLINLCKINNKKLILFYGDDYDSEFNFLNSPEIKNNSNILIFRSSWIKTNNFSNMLACPTLNIDCFNGKYSEKKFKVGFCGLVEDYFRKKIFESLDGKDGYNFIIRPTWANIKKNLKINDGKLHSEYLSWEKCPSKKSQEEYFKSIENNLYTICIRGGGNFSFRLSETFMMGRIPVLIDTDCLLPFENDIPYNKNTVYITKENSDNFDRIDEIIKEFHNSHSEEELLNIQKENRKIWENYFTLTGAFYNTLKIIENR